jgi:3-keto-5-aminohexanoate cleavage enzyme
MMQELMLIVDRIREIDPTSFIMVNASGRAGHYLATQAMLMGLHVRTGTEDMAFRFPHKNDLIESNLETIERVRQTAAALGRRLATPNEYRKLIGLPEKK